MYVCMFVTGYPMTIEWVPACAGGNGAMVRPRGEGQNPIVPTQQTDGVSAHTRSRVTTLGRITQEH